MLVTHLTRFDELRVKVVITVVMNKILSAVCKTGIISVLQMG